MTNAFQHTGFLEVGDIDDEIDLDDVDFDADADADEIIAE